MMQKLSENRMKDILIVMSILIFIICLATPAVYGPTRNEPVFGYRLLLLGWFDLFFNGGYAWLANLCYLIAIFSNKKTTKIVITLIAIMLSTSVIFTYKTVPVSFDEGTGAHYIFSLGIGYYLWLMSIFLMLFSNLFNQSIGEETCQK